MSNYILDEGGNPRLEPDTLKWAEWFETKRWPAARVAVTQIGEVQISTVFLAIDHAFRGKVPILWETMIFGLPDDHPLSDFQERYATRAEADAGHQRAVAEVRKSLEKSCIR